MSIALLVGYSARGPFSCYFFGWEDYVPELREIGLDPAVQGVPLKKKLSVISNLCFSAVLFVQRRLN